MKIGIDARNLVVSMSGIGRYVLEMSRHLMLRGHELYLYLPEDPHSDPAALSGATFRISPYPGGVRRMIWAQTELPRLVAKDKVDLFWGPAHRLPFHLDRHIARVVTIHDLVWRDMSATMRWQTWMGDRWLMRPAIAGADEVVADSLATANVLKQEFPNCGSKLNVVYPGLTPIGGMQTETDLLQFGVDRPYFLFVGTLEPRKNLSRLLEAYALLPEFTRQNFMLVLAGGQGWRLDGLEQKIISLGIANSVRITGYVNDQDLAALYRGARCLAMPSLYEGFGFPIIEANAMGIPALTSDTSSMPEVTGKAGILVDPYNTQSICNALQSLAYDEDLWFSLVENATANAARFDWAKSAAEIESIFERAVTMRR